MDAADTTAERPSAIPWFVWCTVVAVTSAMVGGHWDISWHRSIGRGDGDHRAPYEPWNMADAFEAFGRFASLSHAVPRLFLEDRGRREYSRAPRGRHVAV